MRYLLLIYSDEAVFDSYSEAEQAEVIAAYGRLDEELKAAGAELDSARLQPIAAATTVRVRDGEVLHTDGPFAETKEALGGFYMIEAPNLDAALEWAKKVPSAAMGSVEVRPVWEME